MKDKKNLKKIVLAVLMLALIIGSYFLTKRYGISQEVIRSWIQGKGIWGPVVYVLLLTVLPLVLFPDSVIVIAGGLTFGLLWGTVLTVIGSVLGAAIAFWIARYLGQGVAQRLLKGKLVSFDWEMNGFLLILLLRLIPLFPFKIVSYSAGISEVNFRPYFWATTLGSLPGILAYVNIGDKSNQVGNSSFYWAIFFLVALALISIPGKRFLQKRGGVNESETDGDHSCAE